MPDGSTAYTRDGEFHLNNQGQLVTKQGYAVNSSGGTLAFDPDNPAPINISADGEVSQGTDIKGNIAVTEFGNLKAVSLGNGGFFQAGAAALAQAGHHDECAAGFRGAIQHLAHAGDGQSHHRHADV